jgi:hypothetical protein
LATNSFGTICSSRCLMRRVELCLVYEGDLLKRCLDCSSGKQARSVAPHCRFIFQRVFWIIFSAMHSVQSVKVWIIFLWRCQTLRFIQIRDMIYVVIWCASLVFGQLFWTGGWFLFHLQSVFKLTCDPLASREDWFYFFLVMSRYLLALLVSCSWWSCTCDSAWRIFVWIGRGAFQVKACLCLVLSIG